MKNLQDIFNRTQKLKKEQRELKAVYRDALKNSDHYQKILEEIKSLRETKKQIEDGIKADMQSSFQKLENLKYDIETENELMSDLALNHLVKGEPINIKDEYDNEYEPIFAVRFRKLG
ncbi:MAG: hypothetical protein RB292_04925 [Patescibacteria group bacterium]|jgi:SMC interacting uncharacterized protein involved in chromosome segregation|nr:hypothetical protein [Patescibacteria group bacterium]